MFPTFPNQIMMVGDEIPPNPNRSKRKLGSEDPWRCSAGNTESSKRSVEPTVPAAPLRLAVHNFSEKQPRIV